MHGLQELLVTDNGTVFISHEFQWFMKNNGFVMLRQLLIIRPLMA